MNLSVQLLKQLLLLGGGFEDSKGFLALNDNLLLDRSSSVQHALKPPFLAFFFVCRSACIHLFVDLGLLKAFCFSSGSCSDFDHLPKVMPLKSVLVGADGCKFENVGDKNCVWNQKEGNLSVQTAPHLCSSLFEAQSFRLCCQPLLA